MPRDFPDTVDIGSVVTNRREFRGHWPLARLARLSPSLHSDQGEVSFTIAFGRDEHGIDIADMSFAARLMLMCQRTLEPFEHAVDREVRLGLVRSEDEVAGLPGDYEPCLVGDEPVHLMDLVEDELILAVPLVPKSDRALPDELLEARAAPDGDDPVPENNPFAVLATLKDGNDESD